MSDTYTKLFASITESTIWSEAAGTRLVWITMLAKSNRHGEVYGSVPGLARLANVTLPEAEAALEALLAPDKWSRTKEFEGRRIEVIDGGWRLLNHAKFDRMKSAAEAEDRKRERNREWDRQHRPSGHQRAKQSGDSPAQSVSSPVESVTPPAVAVTKQIQKQEQKTAPKGDGLLAELPEQLARDFTALRAKVRAPITATALAGIRREASAAGLSFEQAITVCCERGWRGFKAEWLHGEHTGPPQQRGRSSQPSRQLAGVAGFLGINAHDLAQGINPAAAPVVHEADRGGPGRLVPAEPGRLPGG